MARVNLTISEKDLAYLRCLVKSEEAASLSHAVRKIVKQYRKLMHEEKQHCNPFRRKSPRM
jgi:hypothetical protein